MTCLATENIYIIEFQRYGKTTKFRFFFIPCSFKHQNMNLSTFTKLAAFTLLFGCLHGVSSAQSWDRNTQISGNDTIADDVKLVTTDNTGNSYWASHYYIKNTPREGYLITKIDRNGVPLGRKAVQTTPLTYTVTGIKDIKFISGNLYIVADARKTGADIDVVIQKYSATLSKTWETFYNSSNSKDDAGLQLIDGPNNGVLVSMISFEDGAVVNYAKSNGNLLSSTLYNNGALSRETIRKIIYSGGSVYIAGKNANMAGTNSDMFIARYDSNLVQVWNKVFEASGNTLPDEVIDMNADAAGDILVVGNYAPSAGNISVFYTKYNDANGSRLWLRRLTNLGITATSIFADASSNVISVTNGSPNRYVNLNGSSGAVISNKGIFNAGIVAYEITDVKSSGNDLFVTGNLDSISASLPQHQFNGVLVTKITINGTRAWNETKLSIDAVQYHKSSCIGIKSGARLYYAANFIDASIPTKRFYSDLSSIAASNGQRNSSNVPAETVQVFPNPATEFVNIHFINEAAGDRLAELYDLNGRLILSQQISATEADASYTMNIGTINKGLYLLRIIDGTTSSIHKMIIE